LASAGVQAGIADRLSSTLFVAALAHGVVILGITFATHPFSDAGAPPTLNVTLLADTAAVATNPEHEDLLADRAQRGAGDLAEGARPTRALSAAHPVSQLGEPGGADLDDGTPLERARAPEQLTTRSRSDTQIAAVPDVTDTPEPEPMRAATLIEQVAPASLAAELDLLAVLPESTSAAGVASPSTSESPLASYLVGWRQRVERIGTANFPERLLGASYRPGRPTLEVVIGPDGNLEDIVVRRSSGDTTLDQAALKILRMAAPFEPLPPNILAEYPVLRFAYEWDFNAGTAGVPAAVPVAQD
jgi:protein TonB